MAVAPFLISIFSSATGTSSATVSSNDAETPSTMTEIVVVPTVSAVTSPSALTVATVLSDES